MSVAQLLLLVVSTVGIRLVADAGIPGLVRVEGTEAAVRTSCTAGARKRLLICAGRGALVSAVELVVDPAADAAGRWFGGPVGRGIGAFEWVVRGEGRGGELFCIVSELFVSSIRRGHSYGRAMGGKGAVTAVTITRLIMRA